MQCCLHMEACTNGLYLVLKIYSKINIDHTFFCDPIGEVKPGLAEVYIFPKSYYLPKLKG